MVVVILQWPGKFLVPVKDHLWAITLHDNGPAQAGVRIFSRRVYRHALEVPRTGSFGKTKEHIEKFLAETSDFFWTVARPVVSRDEISGSAPALLHQLEKTGYVTLCLSSGR